MLDLGRVFDAALGTSRFAWFVPEWLAIADKGTDPVTVCLEAGCLVAGCPEGGKPDADPW